MSIGEEELQGWEARVSKLGSGLAYGESLHIIQEVRKMRQQLKTMIAERDEWKSASQLNARSMQILVSKKEAAEHREKVAMRALEILDENAIVMDRSMALEQAKTEVL